MSERDEKPPGFVITKNTGMSIGLVVAMMTPLIWAIVAKLDMDHALELGRLSDDAQKAALHELKVEMRDGFKNIEKRTADRLTRTTFNNWLELTRTANANGGSISFPDLPD